MEFTSLQGERRGNTKHMNIYIHALLCEKVVCTVWGEQSTVGGGGGLRGGRGGCCWVREFEKAAFKYVKEGAV